MLSLRQGTATTHKLIVATVTHTHKTPGLQHSSMDETPPLPEDLWAVNACWEGRDIFLQWHAHW